MENDNKKVKHKRLIAIQVVSIQAWIKNNPNPNAQPLIEKIEKACINIHAWILNHKNPTTEEELKKIRELKGSLNDSVVNYCVLLSEEKANEIRAFNRKISEHVFYFCESITEFGWEKHTTTLPLDQTKLIEQQEWVEEKQFPEGSGS
jgi:hypothetical protein